MSLFNKAFNAGVDVWEKAVMYLIHRPHDRKWDKLLFRLDYLPNEITYWTFHDNWHSAEPVSRVLCWLGRHDYEAESVKKTKIDNDSVILYCMRCGQRKHSVCGKRK